MLFAFKRNCVSVKSIIGFLENTSQLVKCQRSSHSGTDQPDNANNEPSL